MDYPAPNPVNPADRWKREPTLRPREQRPDEEERARRDLERACLEAKWRPLLLSAGLPADPASRQALRRRLVDGVCLAAGIEPVGLRPASGLGRMRGKGLEGNVAEGGL